MARRPDQKVKDLAQAGNKNDNLYKAALLTVDSTGKVDTTSPTMQTFLLNPSSYDENKSVNWAAHNVPGQSDPVYQYVSGGPRVVTFEALVSQDTSQSITLGGNENSFLDDLADAALNAVGNIASAFAGVTLPPIGDLFSEPSAGDGTQLSIANYLSYYRSLCYPKYSDEYKELLSSPPLVVLVSGSTFGSQSVDDKISGPGSPFGSHLPVWIVTNINIRITKQLPNLDPMEAYVTFTLNEYPIKPISAGNFIATNPSILPTSDLFA